MVKYKRFLAIVLFLLLTLNIYGKEFCSEVFRTYNIREDLKNYRGWMRVCKNDKLYLYTTVNISNKEKELICSCFKDNTKDRSIEVVKGAGNE